MVTKPVASSPPKKSPFWWFRWVPTAVISILILYFFYVIGRVAIVPVLASFALAYLLNPIVYQIEKRGISRTISAAIAILLVSLSIVGFLAYVVPDLWAESSKAVQKVAENFTPENAAHQRELLDDNSYQELLETRPELLFDIDKKKTEGNTDSE